MQLTAAHLRYLLAIYEVSRTHLDISSRSIAEKLGVTKPSVVRILNLLMEQGMIVKEYYGKIYLTDRGIWVAKRVQQELDAILAHFPPVSGELTGEEQWNAALAMTSALPQRLFTADYERMVEEEETPSVKACRRTPSPSAHYVRIHLSQRERLWRNRKLCRHAKGSPFGRAGA